MKSLKLCLLVGLTLMILNGCLVVSLHPFWTKETREFRADLLGDWVPKPDTDPKDNIQITTEGDYKMCFEAQGDSSYLMNLWYGDDGENYDMGFLQRPRKELPVHVNNIIRTATLINLEGTYFLDMAPPSGKDFDGFNAVIAEMNFMPIHTIFKLEIKENSIVLWELNDDRLEDLFDQKRVRLKHEKIDDVTVIAASTQELQRFLIKYANDEKAFEDPIEFVKK